MKNRCPRCGNEKFTMFLKMSITLIGEFSGEEIPVAAGEISEKRCDISIMKCRYCGAESAPKELVEKVFCKGCGTEILRRGVIFKDALLCYSCSSKKSIDDKLSVIKMISAEDVF